MNSKFMTIFIASLFGGTALTSAAFAQTSEEFNERAQYCSALDALITEENDRLNSAWTAQAGAVVIASNEQQCRVSYDEVSAALDGTTDGTALSGGGQIIVTQPDPSVSVQQSAPEVTVSQPEPNVTVTQGQPEIIVRQAQPTITVQMPQPIITIDQPQPEIIVRMPEPQVNVTTAEPEVSVSQDAPEVSVEQAAPEVSVQLPEPDVNVDDTTEADVTVEQGQAIVRQEQGEGANIDIQRSQPSVTFESAEPNVVFEEQTQPDVRFTESGEPNVRFEEMGSEPGTTAAADRADPNASLRPGVEPIEAGTPTPYLVSVIVGQQVINAQGQNLGQVERVVAVGARHYAILAEGGFLGIGEREVALPIDSMSVVDGRLLMRGMTEEDIAAMPEFESAGAQSVDGAQQIEIATP